ncbi:MAG: hypothetical protein N3D10_00530 [Candidatus Micrarchaeota archaeon]|nr:hypothetical protein [Candidatus Micrarchaeota archaeon]
MLFIMEKQNLNFKSFFLNPSKVIKEIKVYDFSYKDFFLTILFYAFFMALTSTLDYTVSFIYNPIIVQHKSIGFYKIISSTLISTLFSFLFLLLLYFLSGIILFFASKKLNKVVKFQNLLCLLSLPLAMAFKVFLVFFILSALLKFLLLSPYLPPYVNFQHNFDRPTLLLLVEVDALIVKIGSILSILIYLFYPFFIIKELFEVSFSKAFGLYLLFLISYPLAKFLLNVLYLFLFNFLNLEKIF